MLDAPGVSTLFHEHKNKGCCPQQGTAALVCLLSLLLLDGWDAADDC